MELNQDLFQKYNLKFIFNFSSYSINLFQIEYLRIKQYTDKVLDKLYIIKAKSL